MKNLPTLYKRTASGAVEQWRIDVFYEGTRADRDSPLENEIGIIKTEYGHVGGKLQMTSDRVTEGKNAGKANATTALQQAEKEAEARWKKQKKKGYVESAEAAAAGEVDAVIEGGIAPMLAPSKIYPTFASKLSWPVLVQPKLDGARCIAVVKDGSATLWTRTRKRINSVPHIAAALEAHLPAGDHILDGELYADQFSADFEELMSIVRKDEPDADGKYLQVQYHVYDYPSAETTFAHRYRALSKLVTASFQNAGVRLVPTTICADHDAVMIVNGRHLEEGYEGSMVRNDGPYEAGRRSFHLQKLKTMVDAEYKIIGAEEGRGKDAGTVGAFVCVTADNAEFRCRLKASYDRRRELAQDPELWRDMMLTVSYQNLTADGIPRFPIGKGLRYSSE